MPTVLRDGPYLIDSFSMLWMKLSRLTSMFDVTETRLNFGSIRSS